MRVCGGTGRPREREMGSGDAGLWRREQGDERDGDQARERVRLGIGGLWPWAGPVEREGLP